MPSPARAFKSRRYTEAQSFNAMIVLAVTLNQIIRFFTRFLRTHALRPFLVTWLNLSMLVGTTAPNMFEKQGDSAIVERSCQGTFKPTYLETESASTRAIWSAAGSAVRKKAAAAAGAHRTKAARSALAR